MEKTIQIGSKSVKMRASALIPRLYRAKFGSDLLVDIQKLQKNLTQAKENENELGISDLITFENIAYIMAYNADNTIGETPDEWLDSIDGTFSIYEVLPEILELWATSNKTTSSPTKAV